ncbi:MAG: STAS domain-containing protein [Phycisphaerales bacterium]
MSSPAIHFAGADAQILVLICPPQFTGAAADNAIAAANRYLPDREDTGIVLDFTDTAMIGSVGIASMLQIRELCASRDVPLVLAGLSPQLHDFLTMLRLAQHFRTAPTLEDAIADATAEA